ncbi:MAG: RNA-binding protein [Crenarchaeota archaeon]|nr:RNA-binding protein [Thermoproteota archaeon]
MSVNTWSVDGVRGRIVVAMDKNKIKYVEKFKDLLERELNVKITVDDTGQVVIEPRENTTLNQIMKAKEVIEAINYGFDVNTALELKKPNYVLMIVNLRDYIIDKSKINHLIRIKGRLIGEEGRARKTIEELSGAKIVISDKSVAIIGEYENAKAAREAIEMLIQGRQHATVYRRLQSWRREMRRRKLEELVSGAGSMFREDVGIDWRDVIGGEEEY